MSEHDQTLRQKTGELEAAVAEAEQELARADGANRSDAHAKLAAAVHDARRWLGAHGSSSAQGDDATAEARRAEELLHEIRMRRAAL